MITARMTAGRRIAASLAVAALAFGVTSCGAINEQATNTDYAASDGINVDVADAQVRNLMFVTNSDGSKARLIGSVVNDTDSALTLSVKAASASPVTISVPADKSVKLEDDANQKVIANLDIKAGEHAKTVFSANGDNVDFSVPVVDGTLAEYRDFVPGGSDASVTEHLKATESHATSEH
ncbi:DNA modification methylase [Glutamicibacter sp. JC586]|uniref:DNA modification methylase n=1 Tax=Glutamicibacter sp. JC586 TaxID=2590552 RepID=UPI0013593D53|nr:DNA modification methylase [Glutamicibacter sp. JC586]